MCYKKIAANLISFIVKNWHYCPIDSNVNVPNCQCWHSEHCKECLLKHAAHIGLESNTKTGEVKMHIIESAKEIYKNEIQNKS